MTLVIAVYQLKKNTVEGILKSSDTNSEKSYCNVYLYDFQWDALDRLADKKGKSRNQILREILQEHFHEAETREQ